MHHESAAIRRCLTGRAPTLVAPKVVVGLREPRRVAAGRATFTHVLELDGGEGRWVDLQRRGERLAAIRTDQHQNVGFFCSHALVVGQTGVALKADTLIQRSLT